MEEREQGQGHRQSRERLPLSARPFYTKCWRKRARALAGDQLGAICHHAISPRGGSRASCSRSIRALGSGRSLSRRSRGIRPVSPSLVSHFAGSTEGGRHGWGRPVDLRDRPTPTPRAAFRNSRASRSYYPSAGIREFPARGGIVHFREVISAARLRGIVVVLVEVRALAAASRAASGRRYKSARRDSSAPPFLLTL